MRALEIDPQNIPAIANLAALCYSMHDYKGAIEWGNRALALNPNLPEAQLGIALSLREEGHVDEAIRRLEQVVQQSPHDPRAQQQLARTRELKQNASKK